jgi:DNA helicase HerA-like ATPase
VGDKDFVEQVTDAYAFKGDVIELGALVVDGTSAPQARVRLPLAMMNRHGLVAGATGTGKTKTLQLLAEQLSRAGVPVFVTDIKGDLSGIAQPGAANERVTQRSADVGDDWSPDSCPVELLTIGGVGSGATVRASITSFGPQLLAKVLDANDVQTSSLGLVFHYADKAGLPLLDLKDLRALISFLISDEGKDELETLGGLSKATAGVLLRDLIALEDQGAEMFFGEPEFDVADLIRSTPDGRGIVSVMQLQGLQDRPAMFSTFLMWMLSDLFDTLPEAGDLDRPKLAFFFDEAHLLFDDASEAFLESVTRTVRLIRSKGVGVYFVTQTPKDVPSDVLAQLGNRIQHALRAYTPDDAKALKATVSTFPKSPQYADLGEVLTTMGIGEAAVTILDERGVPTPVAWTRLRAPRSRMGPLEPAELTELAAASALSSKYGTTVDRESAYEQLAARLAAPEEQVEPEATPQPRESEPARAKKQGGFFSSPAFKAFARSAATVAGREITRSVFGTGRKRRR